VSLVFVDDAAARDFQPFALTRPCSELRAGALLVRQRWEAATGETTRGFVGAPHLTDFDEPGAASFVSGSLQAGCLLVNARCAVALTALPSDASAFSCAGRLAAVRLRVATDVNNVLRDGGRIESFAGHEKPVEIEGKWIEQVWDLVRLLPELLMSDVSHLGASLEKADRPGLTTVGPHPISIDRRATIEPMVYFDASAGPILVRRGATIQAFTRLVGPCVIGEDTIVNGGRITGSSIGDHCRVHGEVSTSVFTGHSNKGHDGFIGHSVLGRWVNLGAGTVNSNLKNNYSEVALWTPRGLERTGMQFLGAFLGDHAKTAIGTRLTTGAVIGTGANVYGKGITPRYVPPFAWGLDESDVWELEPFLETAERAMKRRDVSLSEKARRQLTGAWQRAVEDQR
jgi:UDP-N-acetylglucosamine diphosphorylase/glucosamine-1-phosphate N-acetyltransferase